MNHLYEIDSCHWYSAETPEEALALCVADVGAGEMVDPVDVVQLPDDKPLTVTMDDAPTGHEKVTRLASEWAAEKKGFVASTEY